MRSAAIFSAALVLAPLAAGTGTSAPGSGLRGIVMRGPTRPICDDRCEAPARGLLLQFRRDGSVRARVRTNTLGRYAVRLRPGRYTVTTPNLGPRQDLTPHVVRVPRGFVGRVDFHLDTGIQ